jgi:hypothetical protein
MAGQKVKYIIDADISDFVNGMIAASTSAKRSDKEIQDSFKRTDASAKRLAGSMKASFLKFDSSLDRSTDLVRDWGVAMRSVNTTTLILGATAASGAILGLAGAASQAVGILYTLPAAVVGVGSILAGFAVGFSGIGAAVKALDKANVGAAGSSAALMKQLSGFDKMNVLQDKAPAGGGAAGAALADAMAGLSPAGQAVAQALYDIGQKFKENIGKPVQETMLQDVAPALYETYAVLEGPLKNALLNVAGAANLVLLEMLKIAREPFFSVFIEQAGALGAFILNTLRPALEPLTRGFVALFQVSTPYIQAFTQSLADVIVRWGNWMDSVAGRNAVKESIDNSIQAFQVLGNLIGAIAGVFDAVFDAAGDAIYTPINALTALINKFEEWLRTADGMAFVNNLLEIAANAITALGDVIGIVGGAFSKLIGAFASLSDEQQQAIIQTGIFVGILGGLISYVGGLLSPLISVAGAIGTFLTSIGGAAGAAGGLSGVLAGLRVAFGVLTGPVGWIITALTLLFTNSEAFRGAIFDLVGIIGGTLMTVFNALMSILNPIISIIGSLARMIGATLAIAFSVINPLIQFLLDVLLIPLKAQVAAMTPAFEFLANVFNVVATAAEGMAKYVGIVAESFGIGKGATDNLKSATDNVKTAQDKYNDSVKKGIDLAKEIQGLQASAVDAELAVMDSQDRLTQKQTAYNDAVAQYGPESREAKRASLELTQAENGLKDAQDKVVKVGEDLKNKNVELADQQKNTAKEADNLKNANTQLKTAQEGASGAARGLRDTLASAIKGGVNAAIQQFNNFSIPPIVILGKQVTPRIDFPNIPLLAKGGIVDSPTMAMVGEAGKEAVMPLENNTGWINDLASKINSANGNNNGQPIQLVVQVGEDKIVDKIIELINEKTQMSGRNSILV